MRLRNLFTPSFRNRLRLFFVVIVILPMIAVGFVLFQLVSRSEQSQSDAQLSEAQAVAQNLYRDAVGRANEAGRMIVRDERLRRAIADEDAGGGGSSAPADDRWNAWVFEVGAGGNFEDEERQRDVELDGYVNARRITEAWKFGVSGNFGVETSEFDLDDRTVTNRRDRYRAGAVAVKSLSDHWGAGGQVSVSSSTIDNTRLLVRAAPAVEYSVFPYADATRRQLVFQYSVGMSSYRYREETIFDRMEETRPTQSFVVGYDVQQPWGSADAELEAASFLDDFEKYRLRVNGSVARRGIKLLEEKGLIKKVSVHGSQVIYTRATKAVDDAKDAAAAGGEKAGAGKKGGGASKAPKKETPKKEVAADVAE